MRRTDRGSVTLMIKRLMRLRSRALTAVRARTSAFSTAVEVFILFHLNPFLGEISNRARVIGDRRAVCFLGFQFQVYRSSVDCL
jgi:hypothetical protein